MLTLKLFTYSTLLTIIMIGCDSASTESEVKGQFILRNQRFFGSIVDTTDTTHTWILGYEFIYEFSNLGGALLEYSGSFKSMSTLGGGIKGIGFGRDLRNVDFIEYIEPNITDTISRVDSNVTISGSAVPMECYFQVEGIFINDPTTFSLEDSSMSDGFFFFNKDTLYP